MQKAYYTVDAIYIIRGVAVQSSQSISRISNDSDSDEEEDDASNSFAAYLEYNKVLRTWFVAFGIGGPVLFLVNDALAKRLATAGTLRCVVLLFLVGAGAQVLGALVNKVANWYVHAAHTGVVRRGSKRHRAAEWLIDQFWFDIVLDVSTMVVFGWAAWLLLTVFSAEASATAPVQFG